VKYLTHAPGDDLIAIYRLILFQREVPMDPKSFAKLTPEDELKIRKWKWRLAAVYGAILLFLVLIGAAGPYTSTNTASSGFEHGFSAATSLARGALK
jgi:hypothetical protein